MSKSSPLAVLLPWNCFPYHEAMPIWYGGDCLWEAWAFPGDWFGLETLELEPLGTGPCTWGWVGTGAAMVVAANQATIRLDSTRFIVNSFNKCYSKGSPKIIWIII